MDVNDLKGLFAESKKRMDGQIEHVRRELAGVRTGRASTALLDNVMVEAYGAKMPLNQVATLSIPEPSLIVAQPFDPSTMASLEKAIRSSDLGLNPANDGKVIRIPIPALTEERRKELSRHVHKAAEEGRNHVRTVRRDANDRLKKFLKDHAISEDDEKRGLDEVQRITDQAIKAIDDLQKKKDEELAREVTRPSPQAQPRPRVVFLTPRMQCAVRRRALRRPRAAPRLPVVRHAAARPLRPGEGPRLVARQPRRPDADDVALSRDAAALRRRDAGHAR